MAATGQQERPTVGHPALLTERAVSDMLGIKLSTLRVWRCRDIGPPYFKMEGSVRYDQRDLLAYLEKCKRIPSVRAASERVAYERL